MSKIIEVSACIYCQFIRSFGRNYMCHKTGKLISKANVLNIDKDCPLDELLEENNDQFKNYGE